MKIYKLIIVLVSLIFVLSDIYASNVSFKIVDTNPLYKEAHADPYAYNTRIGVVYMPEKLTFGAIVETDNQTAKYVYPQISYSNNNKDNFNVNIKTGASIGLACIKVRNKRDKEVFAAELNLAGFLNSLYHMGGGGDNIGFDGSYFLGATTRFFDRLSLRFGMRHFSGHYGDETQTYIYEKYMTAYTKDGKKFWTLNYNGNNYNYLGSSEYVRDNSFLINLSYDFPCELRLYSGFEVPFKKSWLRPFYQAPSDHRTSSSSDGVTHLATGEISDDTIAKNSAEIEKKIKGSSYIAANLNFGLDWTHPVKIGTLYMGFDFQAHQDGQTLYNTNSYKESNQWALEYTVATGIELGKKIADAASVAVEVSLHYGRPPLLNYFYHDRTTYAMFGVSIH